MLSKTLNALWLLSLKRDARAFAQNLSRSENIQNKILLSYIRENEKTAYGLKYDFASITNYPDYKNKVPIVNDYSQIADYVDSIADGNSNILFKGDIIFFEETSGSTSGSKLIPYTPQLKNEFNRAFAPWIHTMNKRYPSVFDGKAYWSLSPPLKKRGVSSAGIKIGIEDDTEYLNGIIRYLYKFVNAVDISKMTYHDGESFFIETWKQLLKERDNLSLISIWSPSFLLQLYSILQRNYQTLKTKDLPSNFNDLDLSIIFPKCKVISCWTESSASLFMEEISRIAGGIPIDPKGLLMTEGVITTPFKKGNFLAYRSHFYEFEDQSKNYFLSHELEIGKRYTVIITTGGGLYRYNTQDIVEVSAIVETVPVFNFIGRGNRTSDMVGEKLTEQQVFNIAMELKEADLISFLYAFPIHAGNCAYYKFAICCEDESKEKVKNMVRERLVKNPYYRQAINIGQLDKEVFEFKGFDYRDELLTKYAEKKGMKVGDVKMGVMIM